MRRGIQRLFIYFIRTSSKLCLLFQFVFNKFSQPEVTRYKSLGTVCVFAPVIQMHLIASCINISVTEMLQNAGVQGSPRSRLKTGSIRAVELFFHTL